ncbi:MAG: hypothetical protein AB7I59_30785 [Geminicoccaceae bacterium]|uniref:hypothetical protein n=1 Tax=Reyranella sp. TaxID=1929291 RepID=UPI003D0DB42C
MLGKWFCLGVTAIALVACGSGVTGNSEFVNVPGEGSTAQFLPKATEWCAKYGKVPRASGRDAKSMNFDCVRST